MVDIGNVVALAVPVILGSFAASLLVGYREQIGSLLGIQPERVGPYVVVCHFGTNVIFGILYLMSVFVMGSQMLTPLEVPLETLLLYGLPVLLVTHIISFSAVYLDRQLPTQDAQWRPSGWYYLMGVPLPLLALLYGGDYLYKRSEYA